MNSPSIFRYPCGEVKMSFVKRLLIVLWMPPILALALWYLPEIFFSRSGYQGLEPPPISATLSTLPLIGLFGFGYCLIPSMISWGLLELAWRFGPKLLQRRLPSQFLGGILGLVSGW